MSAGTDILAERLKIRMQSCGLNPYSTARKAGLGASYVRDIIRGKVKDPGVDRLRRLAEALDMSLADLAGSEIEEAAALQPSSRAATLPLVTLKIEATVPIDVARQILDLIEGASR